MIIVCTIFGFIFGFAEGFAVCYLWTEKVREETQKEILKAMKKCRDCKVSYDSEECYECAANIQDVYIPKEGAEE